MYEIYDKRTKEEVKMAYNRYINAQKNLELTQYVEYKFGHDDQIKNIFTDKEQKIIYDALVLLEEQQLASYEKAQFAYLYGGELSYSEKSEP